ncbi:hypothetical protein HZB01_04855 [Candidatus Woesearchaeota archaeon]|nr:hypothetical protein [Candidatus Woesearchaeota archaeon]
MMPLMVNSDTSFLEYLTQEMQMQRLGGAVSTPFSFEDNIHIVHQMVAEVGLLYVSLALEYSAHKISKEGTQNAVQSLLQLIDHSPEIFASMQQHYTNLAMSSEKDVIIPVEMPSLPPLALLEKEVFATIDAYVQAVTENVYLGTESDKNSAIKLVMGYIHQRLKTPNKRHPSSKNIVKELDHAILQRSHLPREAKYEQGIQERMVWFRKKVQDNPENYIGGWLGMTLRGGVPRDCLEEMQAEYNSDLLFPPVFIPYKKEFIHFSRALAYPVEQKMIGGN